MRRRARTPCHVTRARLRATPGGDADFIARKGGTFFLPSRAEASYVRKRHEESPPSAAARWLSEARHFGISAPAVRIAIFEPQTRMRNPRRRCDFDGRQTDAIRGARWDRSRKPDGRSRRRSQRGPSCDRDRGAIGNASRSLHRVRGDSVRCDSRCGYSIAVGSHAEHSHLRPAKDVQFTGRAYGRTSCARTRSCAHWASAPRGLAAVAHGAPQAVRWPTVAWGRLLHGLRAGIGSRPKAVLNARRPPGAIRWPVLRSGGKRDQLHE